MKIGCARTSTQIYYNPRAATHSVGWLFCVVFCENFSNSRIQTKIMTYVEKLRFGSSCRWKSFEPRVKKFKKLLFEWLLLVFFYPNDLYEMRNIFVNGLNIVIHIVPEV